MFTHTGARKQRNWQRIASVHATVMEKKLEQKCVCVCLNINLNGNVFIVSVVFIHAISRQPLNLSADDTITVLAYFVPLHIVCNYFS